MKHTPGPWTHDETWGLIMAGETEIAACHSGIQANARLISAAPEMLEASDRVLKLIFDEIGLTREQIKLVHATGLIEAIKKARGQL